MIFRMGHRQQDIMKNSYSVFNTLWTNAKAPNFSTRHDEMQIQLSVQ